MVRDISNYLGQFFQQKVQQKEFTAYYLFVNKQMIEETEDERITKIKKGLTLEPRLNWDNQSHTFLKNNTTNELYHIHVKNKEPHRVSCRPHRVSCRPGFNSICVVEKMGEQFNPKKVTSFLDILEIPFDMVDGRMKIYYQEPYFAGDHWYREPKMYEIRIEKERDQFLHKFLRYAVASPFPLIIPLEKAPAGALSIIENDDRGALSISHDKGGISVCEDYIPK